MPKLIACGCSNTYGHGLKDISFPGKHGKINYLLGASKLAWPQKLADLLGYECVNMGIPAAPNKLIAYRLTEVDDIQPDDIIVFMWTFLLRQAILPDLTRTPNARIDDTTDILFLRRDQIPTNNSYAASESWIDWQVKYDNDYNLLNENMAWLASGNHYARSKTNNVYNYSINGGVMLPMQDRYAVNILDDIASYAYEKPRALDDAHPGEATHLRIAKQIYGDIKKGNK